MLTDPHRAATQASFDRAGPLRLRFGMLVRPTLGIVVSVLVGVILPLAQIPAMRVALARFAGSTTGVTGTVTKVPRARADLFGQRRITARWTVGGESHVGMFTTSDPLSVGRPVELQVIPGTGLATDDTPAQGLWFTIGMLALALVFLWVLTRITAGLVRKKRMAGGVLPPAYLRVQVVTARMPDSMRGMRSTIPQPADVAFVDTAPEPVPELPPWPARLTDRPGTALLRTYQRKGQPDPTPGAVLHVYPRTPGPRRRRDQVRIHFPAADLWWLGSLDWIPLRARPVLLP